jgi:hypothetical protein
MEILLIVVATLSMLYGLLLFIASSQNKFEHRGLLLGSIIFFTGGLLGILSYSWWIVAGGILMPLIIRRIFGETQDLNGSSYQTWCKKYKPLMGIGKPLNYIDVIQNITDMTNEEKKAYLDQKITAKLFWTVIELGHEKIAVHPGQYEGNVIAWWICDVPYTESANTFEFQFRI